MNIEELNTFVIGNLNALGLRTALRQNFPQIGKLEELDELKDLRVTGLEVNRDKHLKVVYEAVAVDGFYPGVMKKLAEKGILSKETHISQKGQPDEHEIVDFSGSNLSISLVVYNPNYKG